MNAKGYTLIALLLLIAGIIGYRWYVYPIELEQNLEAVKAQPKEIKIELCDHPGEASALLFQEEWKKYWNEQGFLYTGSISELHFESFAEISGPYCEDAKVFLDMTRNAATDEEKIRALKQIRKLKKEADEIFQKLMDAQMQSAIACADAYLLAEQAETEAGRKNSDADLARGFITTGSWAFCEFHSQQSVLVSQQVIACNNNLAIAVSMESVVGSHPYTEQARQYQAQQMWSHCAFYAAQAVYDMEARMPTQTPPP